MANDIHSWVETALTVIGSAATAALWVGKRVDGMITKRVKEQVHEAMREVTKTTSEQLNVIRDEVRHELHEHSQRAEARNDAITSRLDALIMRMTRP